MTDEGLGRFKPGVEVTDTPGDDAILICPRVVDLPIPSAAGRIAICTAGCLERVWWANSSPQKIRVVCTVCAERLLQEDPGPHQLAVTPKQVAEVARFLSRGGKR